MDLSGQLDKFKKRAANPRKVHSNERQALANEIIEGFGLGYRDPLAMGIRKICSTVTSMGEIREKADKAKVKREPAAYFLASFGHGDKL